MARARNIKPKFFTNEELVELPFSTRLLFIGLWTLADRAGRMDDKPKRIKMELFPADNLDVDAALNDLQTSGFLLRYEVNGTRYIQVLAFDKHQNPHRDEKASIIPAPDQHGTSTVQARCKDDANRADSLIPDSLIPESLNSDSPKPDSQPKSLVEGKPSLAAETQEVFDFWRQAMGHDNAKLDAKREKTIRARLKDGYTVGQLCQAITGCQYDPFSQGANDRQTVYDDIELICRTAVKVDSFRRIAERGPPSGRSSNAQQTIDNLQAYLEANNEK